MAIPAPIYLVGATHLKIGHLYILSLDAWPSSQLHMDYMDLDVHCPSEAVDLITHSLTRSPGVGGAMRLLVVGTIGQEERPPRGQLWMEQCLTSLK